MSTLKDKLAALKAEQSNENTTTETTETKRRTSYRDDHGKMISLDDAKAKRWAHKETGEPTKIYELRLAKRAATKAGEPVPVRQWTPKNPNQEFGDLKSPYDLNRRSGQRLIWQALAANPNQTMTRAELQEKVNEAYKAEFPDYYNRKYTDAEPFDTWTTAIVMNRAPFNAKIEELNQRVDVDTVAETVILLTDVTDVRQPKKRGRKLGSKNKVVAAPTVEADNDTATDVGDGDEVEATAEATAEATV